MTYLSALNSKSLNSALKTNEVNLLKVPSWARLLTHRKHESVEKNYCLVPANRWWKLRYKLQQLASIIGKQIVKNPELLCLRWWTCSNRGGVSCGHHASVALLNNTKELITWQIDGDKRITINKRNQWQQNNEKAPHDDARTKTTVQMTYWNSHSPWFINLAEISSRQQSIKWW